MRRGTSRGTTSASELWELYQELRELHQDDPKLLEAFDRYRQRVIAEDVERQIAQQRVRTATRRARRKL